MSGKGANSKLMGAADQINTTGAVDAVPNASEADMEKSTERLYKTFLGKKAFRKNFVLKKFCLKNMVDFEKRFWFPRPKEQG